MNLKYIYETISLSDGESHLDTDAYESNPIDLYTVTGQAVYFSKDRLTRTGRRVVEASSALPVMCRPVEIDERNYYDGGVSDPLPCKRTAELGAEKTVAVLTKLKDSRKNPDKERLPARLISKRYPETGKAILKKAEVYNRSLDKMIALEEKGSMLILAPDSIDDASIVK